MDSLLKEEDLHYLDIKQELTLLQTSYNEYLQTLNEIVQLLLERGFKDYGTVGVMRNYIHQLEKYEDIDQTQVLSLRRHEKDYIIRHQEQYIQKLNKRAGDFKNQIKRNNQLTTHERKKAVAILDKYVENFNKMVKYEKQIGMYTNSGLKKELDMQERQIEKQFGLLIGKASERKSDLYTRLKYYYILFFLILISLIVLASTFTSKLITKPLISLSSYISAFVENGFYHPHELKIPNQKDEIASLYKEFDNLIKQLDKREREKNNAQKNLKETEIHYRELANMLPQCVFETDALGNFTYVNNAWVETFGYSKKEVKDGLNIIETLITDGKERIEGIYKIGQNEFVAKRKDGKAFSALVYTNRILKNNTIVGRRGIIIDNTQRKKYLETLEKAKKRAETSDRLKSSFLANMSHEIRTPVHAIMGFSDLLREEYDNHEKQTEYIEIIRNSSRELLTLINDIIDVAKIEAGEININKEYCNLNKLMDAEYKTFSTILQHKGKSHLSLNLKKGIDDDQFHIYTDPSRLKQILNNLLNNAIKFTTEGNIEFGYFLKGRSEIYFYVKDTGIGIKKNQIQLIFERFRQADESKNREFGGTGLGLTISRSLVELLGGKIWADSEKDKGATFYFTHPITDEVTIAEILSKKFLPGSVENYNN
jgi:PAS domain S-box-containing protein